jgi:predicted restriction endonuclease
MDPEFREAVLRRDQWRCQAEARGFALHVRCSGHLHVHHIELGTKRDVMENVLAVCDRHHRHLHDVDRAGAEEYGLITRRSSRQQAVPPAPR